MAQEERWGDETGEIEDAEVIIEKDRKIELPPAVRNYEKISPLPRDKQEVSVQPYDFHEIDHSWQNLRINPRALRLKNEPLEKLYGGYIKGGIGNYLTPYAEGYFYNKRNKNLLLGLHAKHLSSGNGPVDKENSADGHDMISLSSKSMAGPVKIGGLVQYRNDRYHLYGYPDGQSIERDSIRQSFNTFFAKLIFENNDKDLPGDYTLAVDFNHISDRRDASENQVNIDFKGNREFDENLDFRIKADAFISKYQDTNALNRNFFRIMPYINYDFGDFDVNGGLNVILQNDTLQSRNEVLLYPILGVNYDINKNLSAYLKIDGDLNPVTYNSLIRMNPYLNSQQPLLHTNKKFGLDWGFKGNLGSVLYLKTGMSLSNMKDMGFFVNDTLDASKFNVVYDHGNVSMMNVYAEMTFSKTKAYAFALTGNYYSYTTDHLKEAWHRPAYKIDFISQYNLRDKINLEADLFVLGGIKALDENDNSINLNTIIDVNFKLEYLFSEKISAFLALDNIIGNNYQRYYRYPVRGIQVMGGVSLSF